MGRVSKRKAVVCPQTSLQQHKLYKAGVYARLSSDQDIKKNESIEVQIAIAEKYVEEFNKGNNEEMIVIKDYYTDLGKTGSNFNREGFLRLLQDVRLGEINCVIVKDLSRFGRNYLEAGNYIEKIFPFLGVRFIAVTDKYDNESKENGNKQMASEIKNLVNDMYAKDFSKKTRLQLKQRREEGSYVGGPPPYGYQSEILGKKRVLIPDEKTASIIRFIFEKYVELENATAVRDELNKKKINPPVIYKKTGVVYYASESVGYKGWEKSTIERILESATYVGTLVQGKTSITAKNEANRVHKPEEEWVIAKEVHEPLIERELFERVQEIRRNIQAKSAAHNHPSEGFPIEENIFDNVLFCGVCGRKMTRTSRVKHYANGEVARLEGYMCMNGGNTKYTVCPKSNRISRQEMTRFLFALISMEFGVYLKKPSYYMEYGRTRIHEMKKKKEAAIRKIEGQIRKLEENEGQAYLEYYSGRISKEEFAVCKSKQKDRLVDLEKQKIGLEKERKELEKFADKYIAAIKALVHFKAGKEMTKEMVEAFISKIYVYPGKQIEVIFAFSADWMKGGV